MKNLRQIYESLHKEYIKQWKGHFRDMYPGHNHLNRTATKHAIKNTKVEWKKQFKGN